MDDPQSGRLKCWRNVADDITGASRQAAAPGGTDRNMKKDLTALQGELQLWAYKQHKAEVLVKRFATQGRAALSQKWAQAARQAEREIDRIGKQVAELEDLAREIVEPAPAAPYRPSLIERLRPGRFRSGSLRPPAPRGPQPAPPMLLRPLVIIGWQGAGKRLGQT